MTEPRTEAGRELLAWGAPLSYTNAWFLAAILAIEAEMEDVLKAAGWQDKYESETAAAMNFGDGQATTRAELTRFVRFVDANDPAITDAFVFIEAVR
jgi:hypothetical protein